MVNTADPVSAALAPVIRIDTMLQDAVMSYKTVADGRIWHTSIAQLSSRGYRPKSSTQPYLSPQPVRNPHGESSSRCECGLTSYTLSLTIALTRATLGTTLNGHADTNRNPSHPRRAICPHRSSNKVASMAFAVILK